MTIVDIHCHTFNADDLPVRGFIQRVAFDDNELAADIALLVDVLIQGKAPGFLRERRRLDVLLATDAPPALELLAEGAAPDLEAETDAALAELLVSEPALVRRLADRLPPSPEPLSPAVEAFGVEGWRDGLSGVRRAIRWVKLFGSYRLDITRHLIAAFGVDEVDLCTPMLVDLGMGLYDEPATTIREQIELQEKISRLSMLGRLPGTTRTRVHPFVGFDPRRQLRASNDVESPLDLVKVAVERYGFVGVKLYPPMGFRPIENTATPPDMSEQDAARVDEVLCELYAWCEREQVPVTAHCNASNEAHSTYREFSHPASWAKVLERYPQLHLNLGHFGGTDSPLSQTSWPRATAGLASRFEYLFADVGHHRIDQEDVATEYLAALKTLFREPATAAMASRVMFGSDWLMLAILPRHDEFLTTYRELYQAMMGDSATDEFMGRTALRFLGFDDPDNRNCRRLRAHYARWAPDRMPEWLPG